jgi:hypothetical protein
VKCEAITTRLDDFLDGRLQVSERDAAERHLSECAECRGRLDRAQRLQSLLARYPVPDPDADLAQRVLARAVSGRRARARGARLIAGGFVAAFAASVFTVIYTGLLVDAPRTEIAAGLPTVTMALDETRTINLVFASASALDRVSLVIDLPDGIELVGHDGLRRVRWSTMLESGRNVLPLELVAREPVTGQLVALLEHGDQRKVFRVHVSVTPG